MAAISHLPYVLDEQTNRFHYYETLWKHRALELLSKHASVADLTVLDYGCGRGEALEIFASHGAHVEGVDTDPVCVKLASQFGTAHLLASERPIESFPPNSFDVVLSLHVLEHVVCPKLVLGDFGRIARKYVLIAVPNLCQLRSPLKRRIDLETVNSGHLQSWDHGTFHNLAERHCELDLVEWTHDATVLPGASQFIARTFGTRSAIKLETGLFKTLLPFYSVSIIGLFRPRG